MIIRGGAKTRPKPSLPRHLKRGRKTFCGISGFPTYEADLRKDEYGVPYDPRFAKGDIREGKKY